MRRMAAQRHSTADPVGRMASHTNGEMSSMERLAREIQALERESEVSRATVDMIGDRYFSTPRARESPTPVFDNGGASRPIIMPDCYDGHTKWDDYLAHFITCAEINGWNNMRRAQFLAARLRGQAQEVYMGVPVDDRVNFITVVEALSRFFKPEALVSSNRARLRSRVRVEGEGLSSLCTSIRRDVVDAYPAVCTQAQDELALDFFIGAIKDRDIRVAIRRGRPKSLNEALALAIEIEAIDQAEGIVKTRRLTCAVTSRDDIVENLTDRLQRLETQLGQVMEENVKAMQALQQMQRPLESQSFNPSRPASRQCWHCQQWGHISRFCPARANGQGMGN